MSKKNDSKENVVVVGGGYSGTLAARRISEKLDASHYNLILISDRPYYVHLLSGARLTVADEPELVEQSLVPFDHLFVNNNGTFKRGKVSAIKETAPGNGGELLLADGERVPYKVLVLATGSAWSGPLDYPVDDEELRNHLSEWQKKYAAAKDIFIVGGGAVGIETAGEIRQLYPDKKITLVQSSDLLLNSTYPEKFRKDIERRVREHGIDVLLGEYIDEIPAPGTVGVHTRSGKEFSTVDLVVPAFGARPNTNFVSSLGSDLLTDNGFVKVNPTLEVRGHSGVFAIGDILDWKEQKQAAKAQSHIAVVLANILSFLQGQPLKKVYKGSYELIVIPIGKNYGGGYFGVLWGIYIGDWLTSILKGRDLMAPRAKKDRGY